VREQYDSTYAVFVPPVGYTIGDKYTLRYQGVRQIDGGGTTSSRRLAYSYQDSANLFSASFATTTFRMRRCNGTTTGAYVTGDTQGSVASPQDFQAVISNRKSVLAASGTLTVCVSPADTGCNTLSGSVTDASTLASPTTFAAGVTEHTTGSQNITVDSVWLQGGFTNGTNGGTYISGWKDAGSTSTWGDMTVVTTMTGDQAITMSADSGSDGSTASSTVSSITLANGSNTVHLTSLGLADNRYIRIKFVFNDGTSTGTPTVVSASVTPSAAAGATIASASSQTFAKNAP
jgi:hypothetical protein